MRPLTYHEWRASRGLSGLSIANGVRNHLDYKRYMREYAKYNLSSTYGKVNS